MSLNPLDVFKIAAKFQMAWIEGDENQLKCLFADDVRLFQAIHKNDRVESRYEALGADYASKAELLGTSKRFRRFVIKEASFKIEEGDCIACLWNVWGLLLGENGMEEPFIEEATIKFKQVSLEVLKIIEFVSKTRIL